MGLVFKDDAPIKPLVAEKIDDNGLAFKTLTSVQGASYVLAHPETIMHFFQLLKRMKKQIIPSLKALI